MTLTLFQLRSLQFAAAFLVALALPVRAAPPAVSASLSVMRIDRTADGIETKNVADRAKPGDLLEYVATYSNTTGEAKRDFTTTIPVPAGTDYIAGSAKPIPQLASTDGIAFSPLPLMREVRGPQGTTIRQEVPAAEYRAVRWINASLNNGQQITPSIRVRVSPVATAAK